MRVLLVHAPGDPRSFGGIQTYGVELARGMRERGHEVLELSFAPETVLAEARDFVPRRPYWHPEFLWRRRYYQDFRYHQAVQRAVERTAERIRPDIVHVQHVYQLGAIEAKAAPTVVTCHGLELNPGELVRRSIQRADAVHCNSEFTAGYLKTKQPNAPSPTVLRWGVRQLPARALPESSDYDLITVSRLVPRKNVETVLRALRDRPDLRYAVVGGGPDREHLMELAKDWGLAQVSFLGEVEEEEKWHALSRSRAFVLAPRRDLDDDVEGLGLVYYEAFAAGLPVLAARSGGVPEAVGEGGVVIEDPLSVEQIGAAIDALLDPSKRAGWESAVRQRQEFNSWDRYLEDFEDFYRETMARSG